MSGPDCTAALHPGSRSWLSGVEAEWVRRLLASIMSGVVVYVAVGWDSALIALIVTVYTLVEAGSLQARQASSPLLTTWANLPIGDDEVFDLIARVTIRQALVVLGFGVGYFTGVALDQGHSLGFALPVSLATGALLWALVLSTVAVLVAALPSVPLAALAALAGLVVLFSFRSGDADVLRLTQHLPAGWVLRIFSSLTIEGADVWAVVAMCIVLLVLGRVNLSLLRARYELPELAWRQVPAEQVFEVLVLEEADELVSAGLPGQEGGGGEMSEGLRQRAARNVERSLRDVIVHGGWRRVPRPLGAVERLMWLALPPDQQRVAQFVAPMGRGVTEGLERAVILCLLTVLAAWGGLSAFTQALGFVAVALLCVWPGRGGRLAPGLLQGMLPLEPIGLMWIALEIAAMRIALWLPLLLVQARVLEGAYGVPHAVGMALRIAVLVLSLQPFMVAMRIGGVDAEVDDYGWGSGTVLGALALPVVVLSMVSVLLIVGEPPLTEAPLVGIVGALSLAVFVLHGLRLTTSDSA